jgi:hypothetical protein
VACWPAAPHLQLLLLQLLQLHQEQVTPLLSRQLLQRLQAGTQLQWEAVQQAAAGVAPQPHAIQQQQAAVAASDAVQQQQQQQQPGSKFMPADAIPSFDVELAGSSQQPDSMQLDGRPHAAGAAAAAAALRITTAAAAAYSGSAENGPAVMQLDGPAALPLQNGTQQEQLLLLLDVGLPAAAAAEQLQESLEQQLLLDLAADVAAPGQQQAAAAAEAASWLPRQVAAGMSAAPTVAAGSDGSHQVQQDMAALQSVAAVGASIDRTSGLSGLQEAGGGSGQLELAGLLGGQPQQQEGPEPMQQDQAGPAQQLAEQQQQQPAGSMTAGAVLADKGGKLQLTDDAAWDEEATTATSTSSSNRPAAAAGGGGVPQLSWLGVQPEAPPELPDEPVVLLPAAAAGQQGQPGGAQLFW